MNAGLRKMALGERVQLRPFGGQRRPLAVDLPTPQEGGGVEQRKEWRRLRSVRADGAVIEGAGSLRTAARQLEQRLVPAQMAMQLARPVIARQPAGNELRAALGVAGLEIAVGAGMGGVSVGRIAGEGALDLVDPLRKVAELDPRPTEIGQEPPLLAPMRRQALQ